jgi:hypothetical protein
MGFGSRFDEVVGEREELAARARVHPRELPLDLVVLPHALAFRRRGGTAAGDSSPGPFANFSSTDRSNSRRPPIRFEGSFPELIIAGDEKFLRHRELAFGR